MLLCDFVWKPVLSQEGHMSETTLLSSVILDLGISIASNDPTSLIKPDRVNANLPAIPETVPGANRLFADLIDLAASTDPDTDRSAARDRWRKRLVRDRGGNPIIRSVTFVPEIKKGAVHAVGYIDLPSPTEEDPNRTREQKVIPLFSVGAQYLKHLDGDRYASGDPFHGMVFSPSTKSGAYLVLLLGFADPKVVKTWNDIAGRRNATMRSEEKHWQTITPIPHNLRRPSARTVSFTPTFDVSHLVSGSSKRQLMGTYLGQPIHLARQSEVPIPEIVDGVKKFTKPHTFLVKHLRERYLELIWMGPSNKVSVLPRFELDEVRSIMNPFVVLDTIPKKTDWKHIDKLTRKWLNLAFDDKNPLYVSALELGLVYEDDELHTKRAILEDLWRSAVEQARLQMLEAEKHLRRMLEISPNKPSAHEMWGQETSIDALVRFLNEPEDAAAIWIERVLDQPFDPKSPLHMHLRAWLINTYAHRSLTEHPPPIPEASQVSIQIPELTPIPQAYQIPPPPASRPRELSHPVFQVDSTYVPPESEEAHPSQGHDEVLELDSDALEEMIEDEATKVDYHVDEELSFSSRMEPNEDPPPKFFAKPGSIMHTGELKSGYTDK